MVLLSIMRQGKKIAHCSEAELVTKYRDGEIELSDYVMVDGDEVTILVADFMRDHKISTPLNKALNIQKDQNEHVELSRSRSGLDIEVNTKIRATIENENFEKEMANNKSAIRGLSIFNIAQKKPLPLLWDPTIICYLSIMFGPAFGETLFHINFQKLQEKEETKFFIGCWYAFQGIYLIVCGYAVLVNRISMWDTAAAIFMINIMWSLIIGSRKTKKLNEACPRYYHLEFKPEVIKGVVGNSLIFLLPFLFLSTAQHKSLAAKAKDYIMSKAHPASKKSSTQKEMIKNWETNQRMEYDNICMYTMLKNEKHEYQRKNIVMSEGKSKVKYQKFCDCATEKAAKDSNYQSAMNELMLKGELNNKYVESCGSFLPGKGETEKN